MPWNGSGTYAPPPASFPEVTGTVIDAARFNATVNDLATGISAALPKNGEGAPSANLPMGGYKHTGAAVATSANEYVTWNQTGVQFPRIGLGVAASGWGSTYVGADMGSRGAVVGTSTGTMLTANSYYDGSNYRAKVTGVGGLAVLNDQFVFYTLASVSAGAVQTIAERIRVNATDCDLSVPVTAPSFSGVGTSLTALNATNLASGTVPSARMSGTYSINISGNAATAAVSTAATDYKSRALSSAVRSSGTGEATTYSSEVYDTGSNFNPTTGRFTAPATGVYLVTWSVQANAGAGSGVSAFARVNGSTPNLGGVVAITGTTVGGAVAVPLTSGQYVSIWMSVSGGLDCNITEFQVNRIS